MQDRYGSDDAPPILAPTNDPPGPPPAKHLYDVFISYSRVDSKVMEATRDALLAAGLRVWTDKTGLASGTPSWEDAIRAAVRAARSVVYLASPDALKSPYVNGELSLAEAYQARIFPLWVRGDKWVECAPLNLIKTQFEDGRTDLDSALPKMTAAIKSYNSP